MHYKTCNYQRDVTANDIITNLGEEAKQATAADVTGAQQIVSKPLCCASVERLMTAEETCEQTEVCTERSCTGTAHFKHREIVSTVDLCARRTA